MKRRQILLVLSGLMLLYMAACGGSPTLEPAPTHTAVSQVALPTETTAVEPPTAVPATPTTAIVPTEPEPTSEALFPTPVVTPTPTLPPTAEVPDYTITIMEPATAVSLLAGQEVMFRGEVQPPTTDPITLTLKVGSFTAVSAQIMPDATTGNWELTTTLAENASGPGLLTVALGDLTQVEQPNPVVFDSTTEEPYIALSRPMQGDTAVAGHAFFMQGDSNNLINDAFTIGVLVDGCSNFIAAQKIALASGSWYGFVILPQNVSPGPACAIAYTGEYGETSWREALIPIQLHAYDDSQATLLLLGNQGELTFAAGDVTELFGVAVNVPDRAVDIVLVLDSAGSGSQLVTTGKAFADQFGLWSITLELPDDAPSGPGLLTVSSGEGDSYREVRQTVIISP